MPKQIKLLLPFSKVSTPLIVGKKFNTSPNFIKDQLDKNAAHLYYPGSLQLSKEVILIAAYLLRQKSETLEQKVRREVLLEKAFKIISRSKGIKESTTFTVAFEGIFGLVKEMKFSLADLRPKKK